MLLDGEGKGVGTHPALRWRYCTFLLYMQKPLLLVVLCFFLKWETERKKQRKWECEDLSPASYTYYFLLCQWAKVTQALTDGIEGSAHPLNCQQSCLCIMYICSLTFKEAKLQKKGKNSCHSVSRLSRDTQRSQSHGLNQDPLAGRISSYQ